MRRRGMVLVTAGLIAIYGGAACGGGGSTLTIDPALKAVIMPAVPSTYAGMSVFFDASMSTGGPITNYRWDFGDGSPAVSGPDKVQARYTYPCSEQPAGKNEMTFTVILTVFDSQGNQSQTTNPITVSYLYVGLGACGP